MKNTNPFTRIGGHWGHALPDGRTVDVHAVRGYFPVMAPGGEVFHSQWVHPEHYGKSGHSPVAAAQLDGSGMRFLPNPAEAALWGTSMTRDGRWFFATLGKPFGGGADEADIWKINTESGEAVNLTELLPGNSAFPDASADGSAIVFRRYVGRGAEGDGEGGTGMPTEQEIFIMDGAGDNVRQLTSSPGPDTMPAISPDGVWVVHTTARAAGGFRLFIQRADGSRQGTFLEPDLAEKPGGLDMHPRFSPDGKWIVFSSNRGGMNDEWFHCGGNPQPYGELWAVAVKDGSASGPAVRLTYDKWENALGYWVGAGTSGR
jgi:hypothetical protein